LRRQSLTLVLGVAGLIALSLMLVQVRGGFAYPPLFSLFAKLFQIQFGLLGGAVLAALLYLLPHSRLPWLGRSLVFATLYLLFFWVLVWGLVQRAFGIELTLGAMRELFTSRAQIAAVGLGALEFGLVIVISFAIVGAFTALGNKLGNRTDGVQRRDGAAVEGQEWLREARELYATAAEMYEILPDVSRPPPQFETEAAKHP
jgi:hypothetical protein